MSKPLEIESLDAIDHRKFVVHFSDETFVAVTAEGLADCFPERTRTADLPDEDQD